MDFSQYPDHAFAFLDKKAKQSGENNYTRRFCHHTSKVRRGNDNRSVDLALLHAALEELQTSGLPEKVALRSFNHLKNHANTVIKREVKQGASPEREELHEEIKFLITEIEDNGFEEVPRFLTLPETPVFKVGKWNGQEFTSEDVYKIVENYELLKDSFLPSIKEGHEHGILVGLSSPKEDQEALGYINSMRTDGEYIFATFEVTPEVYYSKFENKSLRYKSCEIWMEWPKDGEIVGPVMTAVAALGIDPPAVADLGEINLLQFSKKEGKREIIAFDFERKEDMDDNKTVQPEAENPVEKEEPLAEVVEETTAQEDAPKEVKDEEPDEESKDKDVAEEAEEVTEETEKAEETSEEPAPVPGELEMQLSANDQLTDQIAMQFAKMKAEMDAKLSQANELIARLQQDNAKKDIEFRVENLVRDGHVAPADREIVEKLFDALQNGSTMMTFSKEDGTSEELRSVELFNQFLESRQAWPTDQKGVVNGKDDEALKESLPQKVETGISDKDQIVQNGRLYEAVNGDLVSETLAMFEASKDKDGKPTKTYRECLLELSAKRKA